MNRKILVKSLKIRVEDERRVLGKRERTRNGKEMAKKDREKINAII